MQISTALGKAIQQAAQPDQKEVARKTKDISDQVFKGLIPQAEGAQRIEELSKPRFDVSEAGTTLSDQLAWARQHGDLLDLDAMAKDLHLKGPAPKIALGEFLQGEGKAWELEEQSFAGQRRARRRSPTRRSAARKSKREALQATARRHRQAEAVKHHFEVTPGGQIQAEMADLREDLAQGLAFAGESPLFSKLGEAGAMMYGKGDPESIGYWRSRRRSAENYVETIRHPGATEQEQNQAQYLQTLINRMDSLILEMQKNTQATERQKPSDEPMPPSRQNMNPTLANRRHHDD